jgi:hypothetical protein
MLSNHPISGAPISAMVGGDIVITAPAFVSTGTLTADLNNLKAIALVSAGAMAGVPTLLFPVAVMSSVSSLVAGAPELSMAVEPLVSTGAMSAIVTPFAVAGEIYRYFFTLTGSPDVEIPIASFQCRLRSGDPTYLAVTVPYTEEYAAAISARPDGEMVIEMALVMVGVEYVRSEIVRANLENIRLDQGPINATITLTGHKTVTSTPHAITLVNPVYRSVTDGAVRLRFAEPHLYLRPGDTVTCDDDTFTADLISIFIGASDGGNITKSMEVAEAA